MATSLLQRLDARDRALFDRWTIERSTASRRMWIALTHMGGLWCSVAAAVLPLFVASAGIRAGAVRAFMGLAISHVIVQILKRTMLRTRPTEELGHESLVGVPDEFSFPSGHATAAMAVALAYAMAFPMLALPLVGIATLVGFSRVCLGVHYPSDVLAGQTIAIVTDLVVFAVVR